MNRTDRDHRLDLWAYALIGYALGFATAALALGRATTG